VPISGPEPTTILLCRGGYVGDADTIERAAVTCPDCLFVLGEDCHELQPCPMHAEVLGRNRASPEGERVSLTDRAARVERLKADVAEREARAQAAEQALQLARQLADGLKGCVTSGDWELVHQDVRKLVGAVLRANGGGP
jgi:hypothetical protein